MKTGHVWVYFDAVSVVIHFASYRCQLCTLRATNGSWLVDNRLCFLTTETQHRAKKRIVFMMQCLLQYLEKNRVGVSVANHYIKRFSCTVCKSALLKQ